MNNFESDELRKIRSFYDNTYYKGANAGNKPSSHHISLAEKLGVSDSSTVLDVACGLGEFLTACSHRGAQVAGVDRIVVATPPEPDPSILAAAYLCNIDELYQIGGAQAIAALAFGTETVDQVDKIVGAGNLFVSLAKQHRHVVHPNQILIR